MTQPQPNSQSSSLQVNSRDNTPKSSFYDEMEWATYQEHRYQTRLSYILCCVAIAVSIGMTLSAGFLLLSGNATQANVTAVTGLLSTGLYIPLSKEANKKIERLTRLTKDYRA